MNLLLRWVIASIALVAAVWLVPGITVGPGRDAAVAVAVMAVILGFVNALIRPLLKLLTCPLVILTLGLFVLVINAICLWLASYIAVHGFGILFVVDGFWAAFLGALIVSVVTAVMTTVLGDDDKK
jgi:putative membrane protein